ncbi:MAG: hypothetical protein ACOZB3_01690 [Calditrichota bacterium]
MNSRMNFRRCLLLFVVAAIGFGSLGIAAEGKRKDPIKKSEPAAKTAAKQVPARINFSTNFQGELEPCG